MRYAMPMAFIAATLTAACAAAPQTKTEQPSASPERIESLINRLGSDKHADRVLATKELESLGPVVLPQLRQAMKSTDAEIKSRAEALVRKIDDQQTTASLLAPKRVHLKLKDVSVADAVAELAKQSGYAVELTGDKLGFVGRKVTLDWGETPFWEAVKKLTEAAGLMEVGNALTAAPLNGKTTAKNAAKVDAAARLAELQRELDAMLRGQLGGPPDDTVRLAAGKPVAVPSCISGSVRVQVVSVTAAGKGEIELLLEVQGEPRLAGLAVAGEARIEMARDDNGQALQPLPIPPEKAVKGKSTTATGGWDNNGVGLGGVRVGGGRFGPPAADNVPRLVTVRLQAGSKPSKVLKELTGKLMVETTIDSEPQIVIDKVLESAGKTGKSKQGATMTIKSVAAKTNGEVQIEVAMEGSPDDNPFAGGLGGRFVIQQIQVIQINGKNIIAGGMGAGTADKTQTPQLVDAAGKPFTLVNSATPSTIINNGQVSTTMQLVYRPAAGQGPPVQLVLPGQRQFVMEVPFTLREIVLP